MSWFANLCGKGRKCGSLCGNSDSRKADSSNRESESTLLTPRATPKFEMESSGVDDTAAESFPLQLNALLPLSIGSSRCGLHRIALDQKGVLSWYTIHNPAQKGSLQVDQMSSVERTDEGVTVHTVDDGPRLQIQVSGPVAQQWAEALQAPFDAAGKPCRLSPRKLKTAGGVLRLSLEQLDPDANEPHESNLSEDQKIVEPELDADPRRLRSVSISDWIQNINAQGEHSTEKQILKIKNMPQVEVEKMLTPRECRASPRDSRPSHLNSQASLRNQPNSPRDARVLNK